MNDVERRKMGTRAWWRGHTALAWLLLLPGVASAQSFSPGDLVTAPLPSIESGGLARQPMTAATLGPSAKTSLVENPPDFLFNASADLSERYTTNALGSSTANSPDFNSRAQLNANASEQTARINASFNYSGAIDYFARSSSNVIFSNRLAANAIADVIPEHLLLSANLFASPIYSSQVGNIAPQGETLPSGANSDLRNVYGYAVSPDLSFRLGHFLRSDTIPSYSSVYIDQPTGAGSSPVGPTASSVNTRALTQRLTSGDYFDRLQWSAVGNYSQMGRSAGGLTQRSATGELAYAITHGIDIIADGGYQSVKALVPLSSVLSGPVFFGGLRFNTPQLTGEFRVGQQYRSLSVTGHLQYEITPALSLSGSASDDVTTPGAGIMNPTSLLSGLIQGLNSGQIQIPSSGVLSLNDLALGGIGLQNSISRIQTQNVALQYRLNRLTAIISAFDTSQKSVAATLPGQNRNLRLTGFVPSVNYEVSQDITAGVDVSFADQSLAFGHSDVIEYRLHSDYRFSDTTSVYAEGSYLQRYSNTALSSTSNGGDVSITSIRLGIRHQL